MANIDWSGLVTAADLAGEDAEDTALLRSHLDEARAMLSHQGWCRRIVREFYGGGVGGIVAVFLFEIVPAEKDVARLQWVVVGDLPTACLATDGVPTAQQALSLYCRLMGEWVDAVRAGRLSDEHYPVAAPPTEDNAGALESRIEFLRSQVVPEESGCWLPAASHTP
jgi:hypothetical protein